MFLLITTLILSIVNGAWLLNRIEQTHQTVWQELGKPSVSLSTGVHPRIALIKYIWSLDFKKLKDPSLSLSGYTAITLEILLILQFLALAIAIL
ncbi:MAG: hypothetical protein WCG16_08795 [Methylococcales bacterium]